MCAHNAIATPELIALSDVAENSTDESILKDVLNVSELNEPQDDMVNSSSELFPEDAIQALETSEPQDFPVNTTRGWRTLNGKCILVYNFKQSLNIS